jgi:uncharacterized repeat protein (TIGR01451 family)
MKARVSRVRIVGWMVVACAALMLAGSNRATAQPLPDTPVSWEEPALRGKIDPALLKQLAASQADDTLPILVEMREQADLTPAAARLPDRAAAGALAVESLRATAESSQRGVRAFLASEASVGRAGDVRPLWVVNAVAARAATRTIAELAARPDVALVRADRWKQWINVKELNSPLSTLYSPLSTVEWGVSRIHADQVWAAFNITGTGVVVANMDTGVDFLHPALAGNYRGCVKGLCQHQTSWYDATGEGAVYPQDGNGHGTHTMGTIAGQDGIGVAPGARWIATRVLNSAGYGYESWIHAGFEWILAPGGNAAMAPDVLSNSWGNDMGDDTRFQNDVRALRAAGIFTVFSNGNKGPYAGTVGSPASFPESFAVGATDSTDRVARFSSRGPSPWGEIRPHVVAPGVQVRSAWPGGGYELLDGTSMAAPHVAGVAALMLSAQPGTTITTTAYVLTTTAVPLTTTTPNNDSGWGRVDAYAAVMAVAHAGILSGTVREAGTHTPISGATVTVSGTQRATTQTGADGRYVAGMASGVYDVSVGAFGYEPGFASSVIISAGTPLARDFDLTRLPTGVVQGAIKNALTGLPITATVAAVGAPVAQTAFGSYSLTLPIGTYTLRAMALGYRVLTATVTVTAGETITQDLSLTPGPKVLLVDSGAWYSKSQVGYLQQALDEQSYSYNTWSIRNPPGDTPHGEDLLAYDVVIWSSPEDSPGFVGANAAITTFLTGTHSLMISGQDVAFWDSGASGYIYAPYLYDYFKTLYVNDDSGVRALTGLDGEIMAGLAMTIAGSGGADNQVWPDEIAVSDANYASQILAYQGDGSGGQKVGLCRPYRGVLLSFGYEAITDALTRQMVMQRVMDYFASPPQAAGLRMSPDSDTVVARPGDVATRTLRLRNIGEVAADAVTLSISGGAWPHVISPTQVLAPSCDVVTVTLAVTIPSDVGWNAADVMTLTAHSSLSSSMAVTSVLAIKTPAPLLLVDDDRWYDVQGAYSQALTQAGVAHDTWSVISNGPANPLTASRLGWYPVVVWFTGYDWYDPINATDEANLEAYLDGGGRLFLSSPFYLDLMGLTTFAQERLGVLTFTDYLTTTVAYGAAGDPIGNELGLLPLTNPYPRAGFFTMGRAVVPKPDAATALWGNSGRALAIHRAGPSWRSAFMIIPFEALQGEDATRVMRRVVGWLGWLGDSTLTADRSVVSRGDRVGFTLTTRHNGFAPVSATMTATLPLSVTLVPDSLTPGAGFDPASGVVTWTGTLAPGAAVTVTYQITLDAALPARALLTTTALFRDDAHGIPFDQSVVLRMAAPDLGASTFTAPSPVRPDALPTYTLSISNSGLALAASAYVTVLLPLQTSIVSGSLALSGPGSATISSGAIGWRGPLDVGQSVTLTYRLNTTRMLEDRSLLSEALLADGAGGTWERILWVDVVPYRVILPLMFKQ